MDDGVDIGERLRRRRLEGRLGPGMDLGSVAEDPLAALGIARERHHLVAAGVERIGQRQAYRPGCAGDQYSHRVPPRMGARFIVMSQIQVRDSYGSRPQTKLTVGKTATSCIVSSSQASQTPN
jgi:hypothetical protein